MKTRTLYNTLLILIILKLIAGCQKDDDPEMRAGTLVLKLTDAASDDEEIKAIYITIEDVLLNEKPIRNFEPKTIEISALKNGDTELVVSKEMAAKKYNKITLLLAQNQAGTGEQGGNYVLTNDDTRHNLLSGESSGLAINLNKEFDLLPGETTRLVADFDLRKAIVRTDSEAERYKFVTSSELRNSIRIVREDSTGTIYGNVDSRQITNSQIFVLIYRSGEFQAAVEGSGSGPSNILFANSISSSKMEEDGSYHLPFLEAGEYDIRLAQFIRFFNEEYSFYRFLPTTSRRTGVQLNNIIIEPGQVREIDIEVFRLF